MSRVIVCPACGESKEHFCKGMCKKCYFVDYYEKHKDERKEYQRQYRANHKEEERRRHREWREQNPHYYSEYVKARKARKLGSQVGEVSEEAVHKRYGQMCMYCGSNHNTNLTVDHIVPISEGGAHKMDNLISACRSCNSSKNARDLFEWTQERPDLLAWVF